jgi:putative ABC transport system permease protein
VPFADSLSAAMAPRRFNLFVIALFAAAAVLLAATGTYAVLSYSVSERADEMAIRRALGARPRHILWLVLAQGMRPILAGMVLGVAAAVALTRLLTSLLFGVSASDPATFAGVALALLVVGVAACLVPAARAALADDAVRA